MVFPWIFTVHKEVEKELRSLEINQRLARKSRKRVAVESIFSLFLTSPTFMKLATVTGTPVAVVARALGVIASTPELLLLVV